MGHGRSCKSWADASHVGSQGMAEAVGPGLPRGHVGSRGMARAFFPRLLGVHVGSLDTAGSVARGCRRPCWFPGHGGSCGPRAVRGTCGCQGMAGAVGPRHPPAMLIPGAFRELWARVCCHPCWFQGHGGSCGPGSAAGHVGSRGIAGAVDPGLPCGHVGSKGLAGALGLVMPPTFLVPGARQDLWAQGSRRHVGSRVMAGSVGARLPVGHVCSRHKAGAVDPGLLGGHVGSRGMA